MAALECDDDGDRGIEGVQAGALEVRLRVELEAVLGGIERLLGQLADPPLGVGLGLRDLLPVAVGLATMQGHGKARRRDAAHRVEHMRRDAPSKSAFSRRMRAIRRCSRAASWSSVDGSLFMRRRSSDRISAALRPLAAMRKTWPNRSSYRRFSTASALSASGEAYMTPRCSPSEVAGASPPRSPILGCAANASIHSRSLSSAEAMSAMASSDSRSS